MTRRIAKDLKEAAEYQFEDALMISDLKNNMADLDSKYKFIIKDLSNVKENVAAILIILRNDDTTNTKGLVEQTRNNDCRIDELEKFRKELTIKIGFISTIAAIVTAFIMEFVTHKIMKI